MAEFVNELVSLHSLEQGQTDLERSDVDLLSMLEHAFQAVRRRRFLFCREVATSSKGQNESEKMQCACCFVTKENTQLRRTRA